MVAALNRTTDLIENRNRWYDPAVGKWLSEDPIGFEGQDANLARYVGNAPTTLVDTTGMQAINVLFNPDDVRGMPWYDFDLPGTMLGLTQGIKFDIVGECSECCDPERDSTWTPFIIIDLKFVMLLDTREINRQNRSLEKAYGHEQQHIINVRKEVDRIAAERDQLLQPLECRFVTKDACERRLRTELRIITSGILKYINDEVGHQHELKALDERDPVGGTFPRNPTPLPEDIRNAIKKANPIIDIVK